MKIEDLREILKSDITEMFKENGETKITWDVEGNPPIKIEIECWVYEDTPEQFNVFLKEGNHLIRGYNETDPSKVKGDILKILDDIELLRKKILDLQVFYIQHIEGHTQEQWDLAKRFMFLANIDKNINHVATKLQIPVRVASDVAKFVVNIKEYASGYNTIYHNEFNDDDIKKTLEENDKNVFGGLYSRDYDKEFKCEHPNVEIHDRKEIYDKVDNAIHCVVVQNVPANLVNYPSANSERKYAVLYCPNIILSDSKYTLDANNPYYRIEFPLLNVKMRENGQFDLILDDRESYYVTSGAGGKRYITYAINIQFIIKQYNNECDLNGEFPYPPVYLYTTINFINEFEKEGTSMVCVKVPYTKSSDGFGLIYRNSDDLSFVTNKIKIKLDDNCTVHYYITDVEGRKIRMHDKCVLAEEVKASVEQFQEKHVSDQNSGFEDLFSDCNMNLFEDDLRNDKVFNSEEWSH